MPSLKMSFFATLLLISVNGFAADPIRHGSKPDILCQLMLTFDQQLGALIEMTLSTQTSHPKSSKAAVVAAFGRYLDAEWHLIRLSEDYSEKRIRWNSIRSLAKTINHNFHLLKNGGESLYSTVLMSEIVSDPDNAWASLCYLKEGVKPSDLLRADSKYAGTPLHSY